MDFFKEIAGLAQLSLGGLLTVILLVLLRAWLRGDIVAKRELDYLREDRDARLADRDARIEEARQEAAEWRNAHETSETARELLNVQNRELVDGFRTFEHFFSEIRSVATRRSGRDVR
jgi:hypothetical protein